MLLISRKEMSSVNEDILRILTNIQKSLEKIIDNAERSIDKEFIPDYYILNSSIRSIFNDLSSVETGNEEIGRKILILLDSMDNSLDYLCDPETMIPGLLDN